MSVVANVAINIDGKQAQNLLKALEAEVKKLNGSFDDVGKKGKLFGEGLTGAAGKVVGALGAAAAAAFTTQKAFETLAEQSRAEAALRTLSVNSDEAVASLSKLSAELKGQASITELTAAAYDVASAGFGKVADQTKILEAATKGAVGGMSDINTVGNAVTSVLNAYGMSADQATGLVDKFIQTQNDGKIVLAEYATQIGRLAPTAAAAGVGIDELNAAISTITAQGVPVESTFAGLNQALVAILKPTSEAASLAEELGIDFNEAGLKAHGFGGLLKQVAEATGGSTTQMTQLFGSVEALKAVLPLTNDNLQKFEANLKNQANSAGVADKAFKQMADTLGGALKAVETEFKNLVVAFAPITPLLVAPLKVVAGTLSLVAQNMKAVGAAAVFIGTLTALINGTVIATKAWTIATTALATAKKVAGIAAAFLQSVMNPAGIAKVALALGAATAASVTLGNAMGKAAQNGQAAKNAQTGVATEANKVTAAVNGQSAALGQIPAKQQAIAQAARETADAYTYQYNQVSNIANSLDRHNNLNSAKVEYAKAINNLQAQELERAYANATTEQQRLDIAIEMFKNQVRAADLEYEAAINQIDLEMRKVELAYEQEELKYKQIEAAGQLAILEAKSVEEEIRKKQQLQSALSTQRQVVEKAHENVNYQREIERYSKATADAQWRSKVSAAQMAFESKATSSDIGMSRDSARTLSNNLASGSVQAHQMRQEMLGVAVNTERAANAIKVLRANEAAPREGNFIQAHNASGGYITRSTATIVGEAGAEYIVPESKAQAFAENYLAGGRGASAISHTGNSGSTPINIQTGPVIEFDGKQYVSMSDLQKAMKATADGVLGKLRTPAARTALRF